MNKTTSGLLTMIRFLALGLLVWTGLSTVQAVAEVTVNLTDESDRRIIEQLVGDMVALEEGSFRMGDITGVGESDEQPVREVKVHAFAISRYEVTFEQYDVFAKATGTKLPKDRWGRGRMPVIDVTWTKAKAFTQWLSEVTGLTFRLPSESEWEYAARAGSSEPYSYGDDDSILCEYANIAGTETTIGWRSTACTDNVKTTATVGSFKPNAFDLYDMHGNVWEWVEDCWFRHHKRAPDDSAPRVKSKCKERVMRGGSWFYGSDEARVSYRTAGKEDEKSVTSGFRVARDL